MQDKMAHSHLSSWVTLLIAQKKPRCLVRTKLNWHPGTNCIGTTEER